ncbi:hypothetical protein O181_020803 [Austropuccinia psidii MF-1]|uniref:AB hydrolase-1 domain-containing protein n=1 Tax=Austropuccinia psidii MF-1 TaxID=1389203 RepID=A0A9Q3GUU9_9BASI|nr:hypothetical protein [Austropuccinia psidii MF-1]
MGVTFKAELSVTYPNPPPKTAFTHLIPHQTIAVVSKLQLSSGVVLIDVPIAYRTWGKLNEDKTNCMVICHALTGSADVEDWWGPLMGPGLAFDPTRYFIFCANALGSPYGTASPVTTNPQTGKIWGPDFPLTTPRDDISLQKIILDHLGVRTVSVVIGGSMGGMTCLEWPLCTPPGYVLNIVPIATSARHSAWGISWGEAQRQSIYSDPNYMGGYYDEHAPPAIGLAAARMAALLIYRSRDSLETRFGRKQQVPKSDAANLNSVVAETNGTAVVKNDQIQKATFKALTSCKDNAGSPSQMATEQQNGHSISMASGITSPSQIFSAQSYLRYQGDKFVARFDANCYIHLTLKLDAHDVDYGRQKPALKNAPTGALVIAISTDGLFTLSEQQELANCMPGARLEIIQSPEGHDGFLLEFGQINQIILTHLHKRLGHLYSPPSTDQDLSAPVEVKVVKSSVFGEAEASITNW